MRNVIASLMFPHLHQRDRGSVVCSDVYKLVSHLQSNSVAHNVLIARAPVSAQQPDALTARVYVWARKSLTGAKVSKDVAFNVAVAELGGQIPMPF